MSDSPRPTAAERIAMRSSRLESRLSLLAIFAIVALGALVSFVLRDVPDLRPAIVVLTISVATAPVVALAAPNRTRRLIMLLFLLAAPTLLYTLDRPVLWHQITVAISVVYAGLVLRVAIATWAATKGSRPFEN